MSELKVKKTKNIRAEFTFPGDKSISHRAVIFSSIADGESRIYNLSTGDDVKRSINAFRNLGVEITSGNEIVIKGRGLYGLRESEDIIDAGNSGTTARLLTGLLSPQRFFSVITGDESLRRRPMARVVQPLRELGAKIEGRNKGDLLPIAISGRELKGKRLKINVSSAQVKSAILLAGLYADGETVVVEPAESRDHTERMLEFMGAVIKKEGGTVSIKKCQKLFPIDFLVPGDISSAAFFIVAGTIVNGSEIIIKDVGLNPYRTGIINILKRMGAQIDILEIKDGIELAGTIKVKHSQLKGTVISGNEIPLVIDEIPVLSVACATAEGETIIKDAKELRKKESDRIRSITLELRKFGIEVEELEDGMVIKGGKLKGAVCESHKDHRIGMAMAIAGLVADGETVIKDTEWIDISFPEFKEYLKKFE